MADTFAPPPQPEHPQMTPPASSPLAPQPSAPPAPPPTPALRQPTEPKVSDTLGSTEYAGFWARYLASLVDGIIVGTIYFVLMLPVLIATIMSAARGGSPSAAPNLVLQSVLQVVGIILSYGYYIYFISKGQTLGKKALKIKVIRLENSQAPGYTKAFLREVVGKMVSALGLGLGYLWMLWDGKKQTWHDKIAGTVVVKT